MFSKKNQASMTFLLHYLIIKKLLLLVTLE